MKILKLIGVALGALIALFLIVTAFLSPKSHMERAIVTEASPADVFQVINSYKNFNRWSPWAQLDPNTKYIFEGPESGVGAKMSWKSDDKNVGNGAQWILESDENKRIKTQMQFGEMSGTYTSEIVLTPTEGGTEITWTYDGDVTGSGIASPIYKVMSMFMDKFLGPMYEEGLVSLKAVAESQRAVQTDSTSGK